MNQRILLLILAIVIAFSVALINVYADKGSGWFDNRKFYEKINDMEIFDEYPYGYPELTVRIVVDEKHKKNMPDFVLEYGSQSEFIKGKEFRDDGIAKSTFNVDEGKKKVCLIAVDDRDFETCKKFKSYDEENQLTFYLR